MDDFFEAGVRRVEVFVVSQVLLLLVLLLGNHLANVLLNAVMDNFLPTDDRPCFDELALAVLEPRFSLLLFREAMIHDVVFILKERPESRLLFKFDLF